MLPQQKRGHEEGGLGMHRVDSHTRRDSKDETKMSRDMEDKGEDRDY